MHQEERRGDTTRAFAVNLLERVGELNLSVLGMFLIRKVLFGGLRRVRCVLERSKEV